MQPETRYARSGEVNIAYQVVGDGPMDLVFVMGWVSNLDYFWEEPSFARFLRRLASFSRLILLDKRGTGLSDRAVGIPTLEQRMDDVRAVMDAVGSKRAALLGVSEGGSLCILFAATYPERTSALVLLGAFPRRLWAPDYPWAPTLEDRMRAYEQVEAGWGTSEWAATDLKRRAPSAARDERFCRWWATYLRMAASPGAAIAVVQMNSQIDVRHVLPAIRVPTLIVHRAGDLTVPVQAGRYMAQRIPAARYVELSGDDHLPFVGDQDEILDVVERFLTGTQPSPAPDRVLLTLLLVEVIGAAERAAELGERRWSSLLAAFSDLVRKELAQFRGREVQSAQERLLATFDGPARAVHCARAILDGAQVLDLAVRAGLHTGECEVTADRVQGVAVQVTARVADSASQGEVMVSSTVKDLVAGSGLQFEDHGTRTFAGLPGEWRLFLLEREPGAGAPLPLDTAGARSAQAPPAPAIRLSPRERQVAALLAQGRTNRQLAEELVITEATAERHVANILNKLGYHSRAQVAAWAVEQGLARTGSG